MAIATCWKDVFCHWPVEMPRHGVLVTVFGEQIPFSSFATSEAFLFAERQAPDATGARAIMLPYDKILALKIVDAIKLKSIQSLGFDIPVTHK